MARSHGLGRAGRFYLGLAVGALATSLVAPATAGAAGPAAAAATGPAVDAIVTYKQKPGAAEKGAIKALGGKVRHGYTLIDGLAVTLPAKALDKARHGKNVKTVERDATITTLEPVVAAASTGDFEYDNAWGVVHIGSKAVHDAGIRGAGSKVAVIDTGIDYIHDVPNAQEPPVVDPEFLNIYKGGYDFFNHDADPMDDNGHGTHVAGILAAEKNGYLVVGVAPEVDLYGLKILGANGEGEVSDLILALQWAVDHDIDVVNMSLGTHEISPALATAVTNASAAGLLMVAASGNTVTLQEIFGGCPVTYPGAYPQVLSTTFTNPSDALTGYSCTGPEVDVASPGDNIFSPVPVGTCMICSPNGYLPESGTSMASPHLAGTVALLLDAGIADAGAPGLFDDVRGRICATANVAYGVQTLFGGTPIPTSDPRYPKYFGCGILDAAEAVLGMGPPPVDTPPVATPDDIPVNEDTATDLAVLANDTDVDGDPLTVTNATDAAHGSTSVNPNGTIHYVPDPDFNGDDSFGYTISDGRGGTDTSPVKVRVAAVNDPPVAVDDVATTSEDQAVDIAVVTNDTDIENDVLAVTGTSSAVKGTASINGNGTVRFAPAANASGTGSFDYVVSDGHGGTDTGSVTVTISPVNDPPVAVADTASTNEDQAVDVAVLANDSDADADSLSVTSVSGAVKGTASVNANGTVHFVPTANAVGDGYFEYAVSDGHGGSDTGAVFVSINPVNDAPVAANDSATTGQGVPVTVAVLANDSDIDGGPLSIAAVSDPPHGTAVANANGTITYTPDPSYSGPDAFAYTASDGSATSNLATVSVTVTAAPPVNPFHIGDLDRATTISGKTWTARVTIGVHNSTHGNVGSVVVTGTWSNGASGSAACTTATNGTCTVQLTKLSRTAVTSVTFTVISATRSGWTYIPAANHDPDGDSTGTAIVIPRP
jgi:subtilisin family serine protease